MISGTIGRALGSLSSCVWFLYHAIAWDASCALFFFHILFFKLFSCLQRSFSSWSGLLLWLDESARSPTPCSMWPESDVYPDLIILKMWPKTDCSTKRLRPQRESGCAVEAQGLSRSAKFREAIQRSRKRMRSGESVSGLIYRPWCSRGRWLFHPKYLRALVAPPQTAVQARLLLQNFSEGNKIWLVPLGLPVWGKCLFHFRFHTVQHTEVVLHPQHRLLQPKTDHSRLIVWCSACAPHHDEL